MRSLSLAALQSPQIQNLASSLGDPVSLDHFLRQFWRVQADPLEYEFIRTPELQLSELQRTGYLIGDCDDAATLAGAIVSAMGYPCRFVALRLPGDPEFSHVNLRCSVRGGEFDIDPIVPAHALPIAGAAEVIEVYL